MSGSSLDFALLAGDKVPFHYKGCNMHEAVATVQKSLVFAALCHTNGNKAEAARLIGINRGTLTKIFKEFPETRRRKAMVVGGQ